MGIGASSRRNGRHQQTAIANSIPPPHHDTQATPPGTIPYYYSVDYSGRAPPHEAAIDLFPPNHLPSNAHLFMSLSPADFRQQQIRPPLPPAGAPSNSYVVEHQKASTIRNDVNLKKSTLRLEKDEENPGFYLVAFSFDATVPGSICIFLLAKEGYDCSLTPSKPHLHKPVRVSFNEGLGQNFRQAPGTGVKLSLFEESELLKEGPGENFPLVVRTETIPKEPPPDAGPREEEPIGAGLPKWVHAQTTLAVLEVKDDNYGVKVVKQIIWVEGVRYELQEIYGIENSDGGGGLDGSDSGKECVICMSEQRDTTVLPCRHMCMCSGCAKVLRFQTNRCPICRTPVEKLLEIKVPKNDEEQETGSKVDTTEG